MQGEESQDDPILDKKKLAGRDRRWLDRCARRERRLHELAAREGDLSTAEKSELHGLQGESQVFEEQYDISAFTVSHQEFKNGHNQVFVALTKYCQREQGKQAPMNVFYLDGPGAGTSSALCDSGSITVQQCYTANRHASTCNALRAWGIPEANVAHAGASNALSCGGAFANTLFGAYYFDGCGGYAPVINAMLTAAFENSQKVQSPVAVGFTLVGGNRDVVDKELAVMRHLVILAKTHGMRVHHVLEDPIRYGLDPSTNKVDGGTLTSWAMLETDDK